MALGQDKLEDIGTAPVTIKSCVTLLTKIN